MEQICQECDGLVDRQDYLFQKENGYQIIKEEA